MGFSDIIQWSLDIASGVQYLHYEEIKSRFYNDCLKRIAQKSALILTQYAIDWMQ